MTNIADEKLRKSSEPASVRTPEKQQELVALFQEFLLTTLPTPAGREQLARYARSREVARTNFALITAAAGRAQDVTDRVLLQLLPYSDSLNNRQRGAWVHVTPAITGDIRKWYEAKRWSGRVDWAQIARAILRFVQRCNRYPDELATACFEFAQLPSTKGFQTGTLTPILNALQPDRFALLNNKARRVLNYTANATFTQALTDYPAANTALFQLIDELTRPAPPAALTNTNAGDLFDLFCHWLVTVKRYAFRDLRYWRMALSEEAQQWAEWREGGFVALGWDELGDLTGVSRKEFAERRDQLLAEHPEWSKRGLDQVWQFARQLHEGDRIVVAGDGVVVGVGSVAGAYYFVSGVQNGHCLPVEWDDTTQRRADFGNRRKLLTELGRTEFEALEDAPPLDAPLPELAPAEPSKTVIKEPPALYAVEPNGEHVLPPVVVEKSAEASINPVYTLAECAEATALDEEMLQHWASAILRKGQAIIYGPPGTGKTFLAHHLARHLIGGGDGFSEMVQFHPSYAYEDFVQGIRPKTIYGQLSYEIVPGRFLEFCRKAAQRQGRCVLIIDEINRANLARVFGELMVLLEYREQQIPLAGGSQPFGIPPNVYLIGTMNTADRSIALVDHALRRRFAFLALHPNYEALRTFHQREQTGFPVENLIQVLQHLNQQIGDRHYEVGISFFMRTTLLEEIEDIWRMEIEPYLEEYFFDNLERVEEFRWERVAREVK
ncbi:MAG: AAA family ATPase [Caldilineaceae bacterium]